MPAQNMHLRDLWEKPEAARKGTEISKLMEHPGWDSLMEALEARNRAEQVQLMRGKATGDGATYERSIGQWAGRESIKDIAEGAVEAGREAEEELTHG
jgi:hypothetical protein